MIGMRAITDSEYERLKNELSARDACILILGMRTGFRISELLSLNLIDVFRNGAVLDCVQLNRARLKGGEHGRAVPLHSEAKECLNGYIKTIDWNRDRYKIMYPDGRIPLFQTKNLNRMDRSNYWSNLKKAIRATGESGERIGTHSMRKAFAASMYKKLDKNIYELQIAMGHRDLSATQKYVQVDLQRVWNKIKE